jgi:hypothetical protein
MLAIFTVQIGLPLPAWTPAWAIAVSLDRRVVYPNSTTSTCRCQIGKSLRRFSLTFRGVAPPDPVRAIVVELAAYEVILGKPWFTRHNPIVDWRRHQLRFVIDGRTVVVDASASPQRESSQDITRISATQLKKVVRRQEPVYLVHLS